ncbi:transposase [Candidatus Bathyarchaeota archaeon]|nr:transposase [Candidatus Bathyarchaeota archaeon]
MEPGQTSDLHPGGEGRPRGVCSLQRRRGQNSGEDHREAGLQGSTIYTDCFKAYLGLSEAGYRHEAVNHSASEWVSGECHINGCENRASLLRPWLAVHRGVCKDNLSL